MGARKTKEEFVINSKKIHGDKYQYDKVVYFSNKQKVIITCPIHGDFLQTPNDHIGGHHCRKCYLEEGHLNYNMKEVNKPENQLKAMDLYVVLLQNENESFIKVGISKEVEKRLKNIKTKSKCSIEKILVLPLTLKESLYLEREILHSLKKEYQYIPYFKFPGYKECLNLNSKDYIIERIVDTIVNTNNKSNLVGKILQYEFEGTLN